MDSIRVFENIRQLVENNGYYTSRSKAKEFPVSLVCASNENEGGLYGSSFWIAEIKGKVYFCSWGYRYWVVPNLNRLPDLCLEYLSAPSCKVPTAQMIEEHELQEITYDEFKELLAE